MPCKSCGSANQEKFIGEMGIRSPGLENVDKLPSGYSQSLLFGWIVVLRNSLCQKLNCAYLQRAVLPPQDNLELLL